MRKANFRLLLINLQNLANSTVHQTPFQEIKCPRRSASYYALFQEKTAFYLILQLNALVMLHSENRPGHRLTEQKRAPK